jgi:hypothetical protein
MPKLDQRRLKADLSRAQKNLNAIAYEFGKDNPVYRQALQRFARLWFVLRLTRSKDEFLREVSTQGPQVNLT